MLQTIGGVAVEIRDGQIVAAQADGWGRWSATDLDRAQSVTFAGLSGVEIRDGFIVAAGEPGHSPWRAELEVRSGPAASGGSAVRLRSVRYTSHMLVLALVVGSPFVAASFTSRPASTQDSGVATAADLTGTDQFHPHRLDQGFELYPVGVVVTGPSPTLAKKTSDYNNFPYGQCTWLVASRRNIPWKGNAYSWYASAKAAGLGTGRTPKVGAIMVSWESPFYGHVAIVEEVYPDGSWLETEMNYKGEGVVDQRRVRASEIPLIGFIY